MSDWVEAGSTSTDTWKPENTGDTITGVYKNKKENVGINNSNVYLLQVEGTEGETSVWGSTVLDTKFQEIPLGSLVKVEYVGQVKGKGPKPYKDFKVMYKPNPVADLFPGSEVA